MKLFVLNFNNLFINIYEKAIEQMEMIGKEWNI